MTFIDPTLVSLAILAAFGIGVGVGYHINRRTQ